MGYFKLESITLALPCTARTICRIPSRPRIGMLCTRSTWGIHAGDGNEKRPQLGNGNSARDKHSKQRGLPRRASGAGHKSPEAFTYINIYVW